MVFTHSLTCSKKDHSDAEAYAELEPMLNGIADRLIADREAEAWVAEQTTHWVRIDEDAYLKYQIHIDAPKGATQASLPGEGMRITRLMVNAATEAGGA